jgi:glycerol uptake facilitator-like aquaporin
VFLAEVLGTALFTFGIASVVAGRVHDAMSGVVVGGSLLFGIIVAVQLGSAGILNPAVALALGSLSLSYVGGAIVGAVLGMQLYRRLS